MILEFEINTKPVPQARPRFFVRYSGLKYIIGAYDPERCKAFKEAIAWHAKIITIEKGLKEPVKNPVIMSLTFQMGERRKEKFHTGKPDIDNLAKAVKDALKGIIYCDDCQIVETHLKKTYGKPCVKVRMVLMEES